MQWIQTPEALTQLAARDRLRPVLIRYRGDSEGRLTAPAQDAADLIAILESAGRYIRDIEVLAPAGPIPGAAKEFDGYDGTRPDGVRL